MEAVQCVVYLANFWDHCCIAEGFHIVPDGCHNRNDTLSILPEARYPMDDPERRLKIQKPKEAIIAVRIVD